MRTHVKDLADNYIIMLLSKNNEKVTKKTIKERREQIKIFRIYISNTTIEQREITNAFNSARSKQGNLSIKDFINNRKRSRERRESKERLEAKKQIEVSNKKVLDRKRIIAVKEKFPHMSEEEILSNKNLIEFANIKIKRTKKN